MSQHLHGFINHSLIIKIICPISIIARWGRQPWIRRFVFFFVSFYNHSLSLIVFIYSRTTSYIGVILYFCTLGICTYTSGLWSSYNCPGGGLSPIFIYPPTLGRFLNINSTISIMAVIFANKIIGIRLQCPLEANLKECSIYQCIYISYSRSIRFENYVNSLYSGKKNYCVVTCLPNYLY